MAHVKVYNAQGKSNAGIDVADSVFGVEIKPNVVHQVYVALEANARQPWADTKDKGEIRGGGRKPWKQKGTGRARHGSIRSPLWRGGGVTFGPLTRRNYTQKINKKVNQKAVRMCLTSKVDEEKLLVLEELSQTGKTADMAKVRNVLPGAGKSTLIVTDAPSDALQLAVRNIPRVHMQRAQDVNVVDLLHHQYIITTQDGIRALEARLA